MPTNYQTSYNLDGIGYYGGIKAIDTCLVVFISPFIYSNSYQWTFKDFISELKFEKLQLISN